MIVRFGRFIPTSLREWDRLFVPLNEVITEESDGTVTIVANKVTAQNLPPQDAGYIVTDPNDRLTDASVLEGKTGEVIVSTASQKVTIELVDTVTPGEYTQVTVDAKGRVTDGAAIDDLTAVSAVAESDYVIVSQGGTNKKATIDQLAAAVFGEDWDDIRFPASQIDPVGLAAPPTRITSLTGYTGGLEFSGSAENVCAGIAQMPHEWKRGSALKPHIHWAREASLSTEVTWNFYYRIIGNPGDAPTAWSAAQTAVTSIGDTGTANVHILTTFPDIDMTGYIESAIVYWRLHRLGNTDANNAPAFLHELDFHFQKDKSGTPDSIPTP